MEEFVIPNKNLLAHNLTEWLCKKHSLKDLREINVPFKPYRIKILQKDIKETVSYIKGNIGAAACCTEVPVYFVGEKGGVLKVKTGVVLEIVSENGAEPYLTFKGVAV